MPEYRRYFVEGGTYFFTVVTAGRQPLFHDPWARYFLGRMMREQRVRMPFETVAIVLLSDHLHAIWTLPAGDKKYSERWRQARFIEHTIRDEDDLHAHADYLHYNPVKHQLTRCPKEWPWSSFHRFVERGHYEPEWGCSDRDPPTFQGVDQDLLE
jgi:putative transposase